MIVDGCTFDGGRASAGSKVLLGARMLDCGWMRFTNNTGTNLHRPSVPTGNEGLALLKSNMNEAIEYGNFEFDGATRIVVDDVSSNSRFYSLSRGGVTVPRHATEPPAADPRFRLGAMIWLESGGTHKLRVLAHDPGNPNVRIWRKIQVA
jgi:hypothetical protein